MYQAANKGKYRQALFKFKSLRRPLCLPQTNFHSPFDESESKGKKENDIASFWPHASHIGFSLNIIFSFVAPTGS